MEKKRNCMYAVGIYMWSILWQVNCFAQPTIGFTPLATGLSSPTDIVSSPIGNSDLYIVQRGVSAANTGSIVLVKNGIVQPTPFLIVTGVACCGERGLLSMVFHPNFSINGTFFVYYTAQGTGAITIARYIVKSIADPIEGDPASKQVIMSIPHPGQTNHNGGKLLFGPDGYLYVGTGDGGGGNDPGMNAQNPQSLLGKLLRINPVVTATTQPFYSIPSDNPFITNGDGVLDEIFAMGLRNPWRWSFDRLNGNVWIADVGQGAREELNVGTATQIKGANFGWRCFEGDLTNNASGIQPCTLYSNQTHYLPSYVYPHNNTTGGFSVTGGYVYRGTLYPAFTGYYIMADYVTPAIWLVKTDGSFSATRQSTGVPSGISGFAESPTGELFAISLSGGTVYAITAEAPLASKLISFTGAIQGTVHKLEWQTANDEWGETYTVERKLPTQNDFTSITQIPAKGGFSNRYSYQAITASTGSILYRIKITGLSGQATYSGQLSIGNHQQNNLESLVAFASGSQLSLQFNKPTQQLMVHSPEGKLLFFRTLKGQTGSLTFPITQSKGGIVIVSVLMKDGGRVVKKVIVN